jgi:hypothetical protein
MMNLALEIVISPNPKPNLSANLHLLDYQKNHPFKNSKEITARNERMVH